MGAWRREPRTHGPNLLPAQVPYMTRYRQVERLSVGSWAVNSGSARRSGSQSAVYQCLATGETPHSGCRDSYRPIAGILLVLTPNNNLPR